MKKFYQIFFFVILTLFMAGCGNENRHKPYLMGKKPSHSNNVYTLMQKPKEDHTLAVATIEAQAQKEIALINKSRDLEMKQMEQQTEILTLKTQNEMAIKEHNLSTYVQEQAFAFKNSTLWSSIIALAAILGLGLYMFKKRREDKLKMHEDTLQKEVYLREKELQVKMAEKILDTIASGNLSEDKEKYLLEALDKTTTPTLLSR